jgi:hypothetical protein
MFSIFLSHYDPEADEDLRQRLKTSSSDAELFGSDL